MVLTAHACGKRLTPFLCGISDLVSSHIPGTPDSQKISEAKEPDCQAQSPKSGLLVIIII